MVHKQCIDRMSSGHRQGDIQVSSDHPEMAMSLRHFSRTFGDMSRHVLDTTFCVCVSFEDPNPTCPKKTFPTKDVAFVHSFKEHRKSGADSNVHTCPSPREPYQLTFYDPYQSYQSTTKQTTEDYYLTN